MQWQGFSTNWYHLLILDRELWSAFFNSVLLGISSAFIATLGGLLAAVHLFFARRQPGRRAFNSIIVILVVIPDLVLGVALLLFFNFSDIPLGFFSLLIAHITFCLPFVMLTINSRIQTIDINIFLSALDLGASRLTALYKVLLPLLYPAVLSGFLLSFTLSFDDVVISYFVAGPEFNILPLAIYSMVRSGVTPELNALCSITFLISMLLVMLSHYFSRKSA